MADFDPDAPFATVVGLPGAAFEQEGVFFDSQLVEVTPPDDTEFVELASSRTGAVRLVTLAQLATLLA
jgi:hypothetical protein